MNVKDNLEARKRLIRLISFVGTIVVASIAVMFTTFMDSTLLLIIILFPCIITLSLSIIPTSLSAKNILVYAIISVVVSLAAIAYALFKRPDIISNI